MGFIHLSALRRRLCMLLFCTAFLLLSLPILAVPEVSNGELLVRFKKGTVQSQMDRAARSAKLKVRRQLRTAAMKKHGHPGFSIVTSDIGIAQALAILRKDPAVEHVEPNYVLRPLATSNDPIFTAGDLWGMYGDLSSPANGRRSEPRVFGPSGPNNTLWEGESGGILRSP